MQSESRRHGLVAGLFGRQLDREEYAPAIVIRRLCETTERVKCPKTDDGSVSAGVAGRVAGIILLGPTQCGDEIAIASRAVWESAPVTVRYCEVDVAVFSRGSAASIRLLAPCVVGG